ncbi:MAG: hypothetical protein A2Y40_09295 [Candidatus Margulisbacteria bacterium GWF2_35_9]|nr:MAG: hypothetical protein A2Y40_09295 [Candidatus Margulisbacteria bacterium GWF2_35_9]
MIITSIYGGLGNQMFQYALGRKLAIITNQDFKYDLTAFKKYKVHQYGLSSFNIKGSIAIDSEIKKLKYQKPTILDLLLFHKNLNLDSYIKETIFSFDKSVLKIVDDVYLDGYWQSEKYFLDIRKELLSDFSLIDEVIGEGANYLEKINQTNSVSIHIRRGDYLSNNQASLIHGICSKDYYIKSMTYIESQIKNPIYFVFSDDQAWVKKEITSKHPIYYMDFNGPEKNYEDLYLMSQCKFNIIANSSFSWWGAWLNEHKNKIVIAPKQWFQNFKYSDDDLIPPSWIRI